MRRIALFAALVVPALLSAQGTADDYARSRALAEKLRNLTVGVPGPPRWIGDSQRFWYRRTVKGGAEFVIVNAETREKQPAFDHARVAAALGEKYTPITLPFLEFSFADNESAITFAADGSTWRCALADYKCAKTGSAPASATGGRRPEPEPLEPPSEPFNNVEDGLALEYPQQAQGGPATGQNFAAFAAPGVPDTRASSDGQWEAYLNNYNVMLRKKGERKGEPLTFDGSEGNYYTLPSISWSPDSKRLVAYRVRPGYRRTLHYVESSPADQLQPKHSTREYAKPGDPVDIAQPVLFEIATRKKTEIENRLFPNPYALSRAVWWKDGRAFTFEYNQRGHQVFRVIEVDGETGSARTLIEEVSPTFVDYSQKKRRIDVNDGKETVWASERDGWNHLYLYDGVTGKVKNQITKGQWVVRQVEKVDEEKRRILFAASGTHAGKDPYFLHWYRINFDGSGMVELTDGDGNHSLTPSSDGKRLLDLWSRIDQPPVLQLRNAEDGKAVMDVERGDMAGLVEAGWKIPEVFVAKGRDGKTDIWGVIYKPTNFDPSKKYPVIEAIYAGPHGSFVPKSFSGVPNPLGEIGFILVQIDGMGTNNRGKAFHDVVWRNIKDAGFPDRILWHKAMAAKYPWYDVTRVGIYGTSAGGQNAMAALLFHPEFYKVGVANSGCHDNRMDKIWWNEAWMGWPIGPHYAESSNVENAHRLQGKLLLVAPEMDTNVDPSSTYQVANALIKANKKFDFLPVPGGGHGAGGAYYQHLLQDFFVHHLLGVEPPEWTGAAAN
jgi:dipeptidyl aminopeptidase/acylaminoacyl peptidase